MSTRYTVRGDHMAPEGCTNADKLRYGVFENRAALGQPICIRWFNETDHATSSEALYEARAFAMRLNAHADV